MMNKLARMFRGVLGKGTFKSDTFQYCVTP